jgi:integrase
MTAIYSRSARVMWPDDPSLPLLTASQAAPLVRQFVRKALMQMDAEPALLEYDNHDRLAAYRIELEDRQSRLTGPLDNEHDDLASGAEISILRGANLRSEISSDASKLLRSYIRRALVQLGAIALARLDQDFSVGITDALFVNLTDDDQSANVQSRSQQQSMTVEKASEQYLAELLQKTRKPKSEDRYRDEMKHIVAFLGPSKPMAAIRRADCIDFRATFAKLPPNFARKIGPQDSLRGIADVHRPGDAVLAWATHSQYLSSMNRFMEWAFREDLIEKNYADGLVPLGKKPDGSVAKLPFEDDELQRIFRRPLYIGCVDDGVGFAKPGDKIVRRSRYWAPLIALFTGLRLGEILQLTPSHFRVSPNGREYIVLTPDMELKNDNAQREIPVHSALKRIGLINWVDRRRGNPDLPLFPEVSKDKYGTESSIFSKRFRSDLKHFDLGSRRAKLTFHSFRHTFKRGLDRAGIASDEAEELCGWSRGKKTSKRYGSGLETDRLFRAVEAVRFGIDLAYLDRHAEMAD